MNFEWDPEKDKLNSKIHGLSFSTAKFVFNDKKRWERYDSTLPIAQKKTDGK